MAEVVPHGVYDLVIANSVFEHLHQPFVAMSQIALVLKPGGALVWHTPLMYPFHGVPRDYFRYTHQGARALAEGAGLEVELVRRDGGYLAVVGAVLGYTNGFFTEEELHTQTPRGEPVGGRSYYQSTAMVARRPK